MTVTKLRRREFLQLAKTYRPGKDNIAGWYVSEKLDGTRCFWDGGISRGVATDEVPWASVTDPKTGKRKGKIKPVATGLWSRYGNPIMAPDSFLDSLPPIPLDGELWAGRGKFQLCRSICGGDSPDPRFDQIKYVVYGCPSLGAVFGDGEIKNSNMVAQFDIAIIGAWLEQSTKGQAFFTPRHGSTFEQELEFLHHYLTKNPDERCYIHNQVMLTDNDVKAPVDLESILTEAIAAGGEGVIIRDPSATWTPKRVSSLLKYKPFDDDEGTIVGFTSGRQTDKGSKHLGKIGALILDYKGKRLELSGLTDEEREFNDPKAIEFARANAGEDMPPGTRGKYFVVGDKVTFLYRELSDDKIPKEARYYRPRDEE
jgi:DNA ligase-1